MPTLKSATRRPLSVNVGNCTTTSFCSAGTWMKNAQKLRVNAGLARKKWKEMNFKTTTVLKGWKLQLVHSHSKLKNWHFVKNSGKLKKGSGRIETTKLFIQ